MVCAQIYQQAASTVQIPLGASQDTGQDHILGLDDGVIFPESHFDADLPNLSGLMRTAAQDRPPLRGVIKCVSNLAHEVSQNANICRVCIALVEFSDKPFGAGVRSHIEDTFFSTGKLPKGSVNEYYKEVSNGKISIAGDIVGPFRMPLRKDQYAGVPGDKNGLQITQPNIRTLAKDALDQAHTALGDLSQYDNDKNGYVDAFIVVHAGEGAERSRKPADIWSAKWTLPNVETFNNTNVYGFLTVPEDVTTGVSAHELGHLLFGWPDLYDTKTVGVEQVAASHGIGDWCLMAHGTWLDNGNRPCHPSAWCKVTQGWVDLTTEEDARSISLGPVQTTMDVRRLWKGGIKESREYFLLENRQQIGSDSLIPGPGLLG